jgi:hypothetical protein
MTPVTPPRIEQGAVGARIGESVGGAALATPQGRRSPDGGTTPRPLNEELDSVQKVGSPHCLVIQTTPGPGVSTPEPTARYQDGGTLASAHGTPPESRLESLQTCATTQEMPHGEDANSHHNPGLARALADASLQTIQALYA